MKTVAELVASAKARIQNLTPQQVSDEMGGGNVVLVDLREPQERQQHGVIPGAISVPRGMLEFVADPASKYHRGEFDPGKRIIVHCAAGGRSALAAATLTDMGYSNVAHMDGGFTAWKEQGRPVESEGGAAS